MNFSPGSPIFIILIIVLFFGLGVLFGKMFIKKKKVEKFSVNAPMTGVPIDMPLVKAPGVVQGNKPGYQIKAMVLA